MKLDQIDIKILVELQKNGRITNVELARKVGMSPPPCLRRTRALEQAGIIAGCVVFGGCVFLFLFFVVVFLALIFAHRTHAIFAERSRR